VRKLSKLIATLTFIGYIPRLPGTAASLAAIPIYLLVKENTPLYLIVTALFLAIGFWSASGAEGQFRRKDPPQIVIDEFASMFLVYLFIPYDPRLLVIGFVLFRIFDIFKLPPLKKLEKLPRACGIMLDDIAAAILANLILQVLRYIC